MFCSLKRGITPKICVLCFVIINSVLLNVYMCLDLIFRTLAVILFHIVCLFVRLFCFVLTGNHSCTDTTDFKIRVDTLGRRNAFRKPRKGLMRRRKRKKKKHRRRRMPRCNDYRCLCHLDPVMLHMACHASERLNVPMVEVSTSESSRASTESMQPFVDPVQPDVIGLVVCLCVFVYPSLCLLYTSPSPRDMYKSRMPSSA